MTEATATEALATEAIDLDHLRQWIGRTEEKTDIVTAHLVAGLRSALFLDVGNPKDGDAAPFTAHWCLTLPVVALSEVSADGHPTRGGFLPPVPLPRRMWAGSEFEFRHPLRIGDEVTRVSTIDGISEKAGRSGPLVFVKVRHELRRSGASALAVAETHDIVYREAPRPGAVAPPASAAPGAAAWERRVVPDAVLLFRYSALTFNGHRIHYDRDYVTKVEGYPGLIFHGPLQASFIVELAARLRDGKPPRKFSYRGLQPLFEGSEFSINANEIADGMELWTANSARQPTMKGTATW